MFDPDNGLFMALFKVRTLTNAQHKYKIDVNAEENMLTGCVLTADSFSLVVIEGCSKSVKRYKKLMLKRIQWDAWIAGEEAPEDIEGNFCKLLWEGTIISTHFKRFRQEVQKTDDSARKYLGDFGLSHLWDLAIEDK
jgi:U4/U6 small nuclear ribonucleoprotein PRP3